MVESPSDESPDSMVACLYFSMEKVHLVCYIKKIIKKAVVIYRQIACRFSFAINCECQKTTECSSCYKL